jgi:flagellar hook-associated protein 3 FlgL
MTNTFISSTALSDATRTSLMKLQRQLADAQREVTTGRLADPGLSLGYQTGQTVSLRREHARLQSISETNNLVASRLDASQAALKALAENAQTFLGQLAAGSNGAADPRMLQQQARAALSTFANLLGATFQGASLFAGINTDVQPIADYNRQPPPASAQAVANAFFAAFGITQSDAGVSAISATDMQTFVDGSFAGLFNAAAWNGTWSQASDQYVKSRISISELIETSVNANDVAFRKLASAFTMLADLGTDKLGQAAYQVVVDAAMRATSEALEGITRLQAKLGTAQERIKNANERMSIQVSIITNHIGVLEGVDPYEASNRVASLMTQVETAYAMTARIHKMTLLDYLPLT